LCRYNVTAACVEYALEAALLPSLKGHAAVCGVGLAMVVLGDGLRKVAVGLALCTTTSLHFADTFLPKHVQTMTTGMVRATNPVWSVQPILR
jgi:hypothetical protein